MKTIKGKIIIFFLALTLFVFLALGAAVYVNLDNTVKPMVKEMGQEIVSARADEIGELINGVIKENKQVARKEVLKTMDWKQVKPVLKETIEESDGLYDIMFLADKEGNKRDTTGNSNSIADRSFYQEIIEEGKDTSISNVITSRATGKKVFVVTQAIKNDQGETIGILGTAMFLKKIANRVKGIQIAKAGYGWLADQRGEIIAHPNQDLVLETNVANSSQAGYSGLEKLSEQLTNKQSGAGQIRTPQEEAAFLAFEPIPQSPGWTLAVTVPVNKLLGEVKGLIQLVVLIILGALLLMAVGSYWVGNRIAKPIDSLAEKVVKFGNGDFKVDFDIEDDSEIGDMAAALEKMKNNLRDMIVDLVDSAEDLSAYSEELSASAEEGNAVIEATHELVEDISASIEEISASTQEVSSFAQESSSKTEVGRENIEDTLASIKEINNSTDEAVQVINELDNTAGEIGQIIEMITNIADQTNLLALNAAIEAARAGSGAEGAGGQGFAVVAEEIRELAEETNQATEKIAELIEITQSKADSGLKAVEEVKSKAAEGKEVAQATKEVFGEIQSTSEETAHQIEQTADATQNLAERGEQVKESTEEIEQMSDEITKSSQELADMAQKLQGLVDNFKV